MHARNLFLTVLGSGTLLGTLGGLAVDTEMKPPPEPPWRHAVQRDPVSTDSYEFVDSGPQDLSPAWYADRTPTWKRDLTQPAVYAPMRHPDDMAEPVDEPAMAAEPPALADRTSPLAAWADAAAPQNAAEGAKDAVASAHRPDTAEQQAEPAEDAAAL